METIDLKTAEYWKGPGVDLRLNPSLTIDRDGLDTAIKEQGIKSAVVLATSGTQGYPKLVVLEKRALLRSAESVNDYCKIDRGDSWLAVLSTFHVGGLAIYARAHLSESKINELDWDQWTRDGKAFLDSCRDSTLTSLTPVHLYDLVQSGISPPDSLRGVFVGGGALSENLANRARDLGWPLWTSYGMTEACSQIATSLEGGLEWLPVLPHWQTQLSPEGKLKIRGDSLMRGYFTYSGSWIWNDAIDDDGYYRTGDLVEIRGRSLKVLGRADDLIKIYGELVSLGRLEESLGDAVGANVILIPEPDSRTGVKLIAVIEKRESQQITKKVGHWSRSQPKYIRIERIEFLPEFRRTRGGKIDRSRIDSLLNRSAGNG